ncbi:hypothetical protein [Mycobacterium sp. NPDC006124]|uniref:hypothetical protein n=1 Tax=Mycobacterium sp. NPDC006124 TaxID=3156729 RepID=UPI0033A4D8DB
MMQLRRESLGPRFLGRGLAVVGGLTRGVGALHDVAMMTAVHVRRLATIVAGVDAEIRELVLDVRDVALTGLAPTPTDVVLRPDVGHVQLRRPAAAHRQASTD